eukprot:CAMPEP_0201530384 /NCGR_PEP_ID=MMETSP0161_2-20130828/44515_1 /ASSEMBLY_ACC=CAM_ASM_000251 /TAXON_ID=180227 /ORGANISM="Neoparamoeba aestuarina, Strain SoJaBio B1-5/56/2" /LENGTH=244 /DNA_ID=CAMNT_0047932719 /DNA_START=81 /DNA_END=815 /DNA_ORIENTATION=-
MTTQPVETSWLVATRPVKITTIPILHPNSTDSLVVCFPLNEDISVENVHSPQRLKHRLDFFVRTVDNNPNQPIESNFIQLPEMYLPFKSCIGTVPRWKSNNGSAHAAVLKEVSTLWKSFDIGESPITKKQFELTGIKNLCETFTFLQSSSEMSVIGNHHDVSLSTRNESEECSGYHLFWMLGSFLPEVSPSLIMLKCKIAFGISGKTLCQVTLRGGNSDFQEQLFREIFDQHQKCLGNDMEANY